MHIPKKVFLGSLVVFIFQYLPAQALKPGFSKDELRSMLEISARFGNTDTAYLKDIPYPEGYRKIYESPDMGLDNRWCLWSGQNQTIVLSIRGTTAKSESWLANFYAAMVPAKGSLHISHDFIFDYSLATNPKAAVHIGWLFSTAFLIRDMMPKIDSSYAAGIRDIYITGHSQGGAISYLVTAYLRNLQAEKKLPGDIHFKTYCTAAPKPGNLYFAYDYEAMTQNGWAYNAVNTADWVPELIFSIQTLNDLNTTNPFVNAKDFIRKQSFPKNIVLSLVYNRLRKLPIRSQEKYEKYLGGFTTKLVKKYYPEFEPPAFYNSIDYVRTGNTIVLQADEAYFQKYPDDTKKVFVHHFHQPYLYLLDKLK